VSSPNRSTNQVNTDSAPDSLAAVDITTDLFTTNLDLWVQMRRGSTYLSAFGLAG
jgi:hypothetical protein